MTSGNCSKSYHPGLKLFLFSLKRQTAITLLVTGFLFLLCPGLLLHEYMDSFGYYNLDNQAAAWAMIIFTAGLALGVILLCYNHAHLFSRKTADLYYALPVKRDSLLAIRFGAAFTGAAFTMTTAFISLAAFSVLPDVEGIGPLRLLQLYLLCLMLLLLCLSTLLLFLVNSGGIFHFLFSVAVICVGIPVLCLIAQSNYESAAAGAVTEDVWLKYTSPFIYAYWLLFDAGELLYAGGQGILLPSAVAICLGGSILFLALSFVMHHNRKAERSGSSFSNSIVPYLITVIAACVGGYLVGVIFDWSGNYDGSFWFFLIHGALLVSLAAGAIVSKGFRKLWRWLICAGAAVVLMVGILLGSQAMGESTRNYIPPKEELLSVTIEGTYNTPEVTFTSDFELILRLHEHRIAAENGVILPYGSLVEAGLKYGTETVTTERYFNIEILNPDVTITYELKNGEKLTRSYWVNDPDGLLLLFDIVSTDTYAESWNFPTYPRDYVDYSYYDGAHNFHDADVLTPEESALLLDTFGRELQRSSPEILWTEDYVILELDNGALWQQLYVPKSFTETLTLAEELLD